MAQSKQELVVEVTTKADQAKRDLAELDKKAKEIGDKPIEIPVKPVDLPNVDETRHKVDELGRSAEGSRNAFANLVGNSAQDLGGLLGPLGSVGVAVGQVAEYTSDATLGGESMTSALSGAASMAVPMLGLSAALLVVTSAVEGWKKRQAELKQVHEDSVASFIEGTGVIKNWGDALDEAFNAGTADRVDSMSKILSDRFKPDELNRVAKAVGEVGLNMADLGDIMTSADADFEAFARTQLLAAGAAPKLADAMAALINETGTVTDFANNAQGGLSRMFDELGPDQVEKLNRVAAGLEELDAQAQNVDLQKVAADALDVARAFDAAGVAAAEAGAKTPLDAYQRYTAAAQETTKALEDAKRAQDDWLLSTVDAQAEVDQVTTAIGDYKDMIDKQAAAAASGTQTTREKIDADIAQREAMAGVVREGADVIRSYQDQGLTADQARAKQNELAQQQYALAIAMGLPEAAAAQIRDTLLQIPQNIPVQVPIDQRGDDPKGYLDSIPDRVDTTVWINGVLDRSILDAIHSLPPGTIPSSRSVAPSPAAAPAAGPTVVAAPPAPAAPAGLSGRSATTNVNVNLSGAIVADTFQLQRVVARAVRQGNRLNGTR